MESIPALKKPKVLVVLGATATGKSALAIRLARTFSGEIISADSRQVYTGLDIGTGKVTHEEMLGISHHLLSITDPILEKKRYSVAEWVDSAKKITSEIIMRKNFPIICGGTGFYIDGLIQGNSLPAIPHDPTFEKAHQHETTELLYEKLKTLDPKRAEAIDMYNRRRVLRSLEIAQTLGKVPEITTTEHYNTLKIGITLPDPILKGKIKARLITRIDAGMIEEAERLHQMGLSYERMHELGLEYRYLALYLQGTLTKESLIETLATKIWQYARRQKAWFKRDQTIIWHELTPESYEKEYVKIENEIKNWLTK